MNLLFKAYFIIFTFFLIGTGNLESQISHDTLKSVKLTASVDVQNSSITLKWIIDPGSTRYEVFKKNPTASSWGSPLFETAINDSTYTDLDIEINQLYEYRVKKFTAGNLGYGYLRSGIDYKPESSNRGVLLVIEQLTYDSTQQEIAIFEDALFHEGWIVKRKVVSRDASVQSVKDQIKYVEQSFAELSTVILLGNVPVPHSGNVNPDAHSNHKGGWPADLYYGELNGIWTDELVSNTTSENPRNHNIPGDGNLDQDFIPDSIDLIIGRIDFSELPIFEINEFELLKSYIAKNISYRTKKYIPKSRAVFKNRNPWNEGLGQNALRNFSVLVSPDSIVYFDYFDAFYDTFLWAYGGSSGSQIGSLGLGAIDTYADNNFQATFTGYFGSYFGDYDFENNFLRTILASGKVLSTAWVGAPHWFYHPMAMGAGMGDCTILTQNNVDTYHAGYFPGGIHINLLGDPTLRSYVAPPPSDLLFNSVGNSVELQWSPPSDDYSGFNIYRIDQTNPYFAKLNNEVISDTNFIDTCATQIKDARYLVRTVKREITPSGVYLNESAGVSVRVQNGIPIVPVAEFAIHTSGDSLFTTNTSINAQNYVWILSNDTISIEKDVKLLLTENLEITLVASNACFSDNITHTYIYSQTVDPAWISEIKITPNPILCGEKIHIELSESNVTLNIYESSGKLLQTIHNLKNGSHTIDLPKNISGYLFLKFSTQDRVRTRRLLLVD